MFSQIQRFARRFALMLGGEAMQSAFHFAFNIALVHALPPRDYGIFATVLLCGGLSLTYIRGLVGVPAGMFIPPALGRRAALAIDVTFGSGALVLSAVAGVTVAAGLHFWIGEGALAGGAFVGLWSMRSYLRTAFFARHQQLYAGLSDVVFTLSGAILAGLVLHGVSGGLLNMSFIVLALANALSIATALLFPLRRIRISYRRSMRARFARLGRQSGWSFVGVTTGNLQAQGQVMLVIMLAGATGYAPIAAMLAFFAPLRLLGSALGNMMQPEIATLLARGDRGKIRELLPFWSLMMLAVSAAYGLATLMLLPKIAAPVFDGQPKGVLWLFALLVSSIPLLYIMPRTLLETNRSFRDLATIASISAVVSMSFGAALLLVTTPVWSLTGILTGELIVLCCCWVAVRDIKSTGPNSGNSQATLYRGIRP